MVVGAGRNRIHGPLIIIIAWHGWWFTNKINEVTEEAFFIHLPTYDSQLAFPISDTGIMIVL